ncbi:Uncharacterised protein [Mycobacteroides abscessus subsp. abscessus]|nr:Uncharacterised protein [Mycobacteroides abscessus subsp. abscessus]
MSTAARRALAQTSAIRLGGQAGSSGTNAAPVFNTASKATARLVDRSILIPTRPSQPMSNERNSEASRPACSSSWP